MKLIGCSIQKLHPKKNKIVVISCLLKGEGGFKREEVPPPCMNPWLYFYLLSPSSSSPPPSFPML